jgi:2-dehydro-3-deoxygalactonokinase
MSAPLLAVDWGTSSLRAALLDTQGQVLEARQFEQGILHVPVGAFESVFQHRLGDWMEDPDRLCLISGMAGSRQGWREAPYCSCPAGFGDLAAQLLWISPRIALVPGLHCINTRPDRASAIEPGQDDVMRGEEVQIFGALSITGLSQATLVLPGTHSKWAQVRDAQVHQFQSFMTGEFYALLSQHSILARTLVSDAPWNEASFVQAVEQAQSGPGLLAHAFGTRTSALFERLPPEALSSHLSGLLIGEELRAMQDMPDPLVLVGNASLTARYALALRALGRTCTVLTHEATWAGLAALAKTLPKIVHRA